MAANSALLACLPHQGGKHVDAVRGCSWLHQMATSTMQTIPLTAAILVMSDGILRMRSKPLN